MKNLSKQQARNRTEYNKAYNAKHKERLRELKMKYREQNKEFIAEYNRKYARKHKQRLIEYREDRKPRLAQTQRWRKYGLPDGVYASLEILQEKRCAICCEVKPLCIDHCHKTGKVRGLLCRKCNSMLGFMNDSIEILRRAEVYLTAYIENKQEAA